MTAEFTPGPWRVRHYREREFHVRPIYPAQGFSDGFKPIARVVLDGRLMSIEECQANANLIAAAPDLIVVVSEALALIKKIHASNLIGKNWLITQQMFAVAASAEFALATAFQSPEGIHEGRLHEDDSAA